MIDASIYNLQKPLPAPVNPMEVAGHAMQLRNAQQTNQLNAERLKQEQQQTAAAEQALADERTARTTLAEHGGDLDKAIPALAGKISTGAWEKLNQQASNLRKARAEMDEKDRAKLDWQLGMLSDARLAVLNAPPDQKEAEHQRQGQRIAAIAPDLAQKWEPQYPGDDAVKSEIGFAKWFKSDQEQKDAARKAQQATDTHNAAALKLSTDQRQQDAAQLALAAEQGGPEGLAAAIAQLPPGDRRKPFLGVKPSSKPDDIRRMGMDATQVVTANQRAADAARQAMPNTPTELAIWANDPKRTPQERQQAQAALKQLEQHAIASRPIINNSIPGMQIGGGGTNQTTGEEFLKTVPPSIAAQVKAIAEGRSAIPSASSRSQAAAQIRDAVFRYDPTFSEQRAQVRKAFTTGPEGKNIGALNTAIVHLGRLGDTADALQNGSFTPGNELYNWARDKFGSEKVTNFGLLKDAVAGEMAAALKGTATDIEIEKMGKSIRASNSPAQMRGVIQEGMGILSDKANTYDERYHRENADDTVWSPILPSAKAQLERHGVKKTGGSQTSTGGRKPLSSIWGR